MSSDSARAILEIEANGDSELAPGGDEGETTRMMGRDTVMSSDSASAILETEANRDRVVPPGGDDAETKRKISILHMMGIEDEQKFGMYLLGVAIPVGVTLVFSPSSLVHSTEMRIVAVSLSATVTLTCNGLCLHGNFPRTSTWMLLSGAGLMTLSFFALIALFLPPYLKGIPVLFCLACLIPFAMSARDHFPTD